MGRDVSLDIRLRPLDSKRFVGDFVRKLSAWIPEGSPVRTTRGVLRCALADLDWLDRDFKYSRKTRCWTAHGDQVINAQQEDDLREFIAWCARTSIPKPPASSSRLRSITEFMTASSTSSWMVRLWSGSGRRWLFSAKLNDCNREDQ